MSLKNDPHASTIRVLKKHKLDDLIDVVARWDESEPIGPGDLKKDWICQFNSEPGNVDDDGQEDAVSRQAIDLKDPTTWGESSPDMPLPRDEFFLELYKALRADEKRRSGRSSYEF